MNSPLEDETNDSTERLLQNLKEVVADGEELLRAGADQLNEQGMAAHARLSAALEAAKETGLKLQERTIAGAKATDKAIRENPYQSIGIAFGIGLLIGILVKRSRE